MVTRVDRLARNIKDLQDIVFALNQQSVTLRATEQPVDTRSAAGKAFLDDMLLCLKPTFAGSVRWKVLPRRKFGA